jgi:hypothetical protein
VQGTASVSDVTVLLIVGIHKLFSGVESPLSLMDGRTVKMPGPRSQGSLEESEERTS